MMLPVICSSILLSLKCFFFSTSQLLYVFKLSIYIRQFAWCCFQELQKKVKFLGWNSRYWFVAVTVVGLLTWAIWRLIQKASLFNLLFLFYPLLLYLSLFGFTLEPRPYRDRFKPPLKFLQHISMAGRMRVDLYNYTHTTQGTTHDQRNTDNSLLMDRNINALLLPATPDEIRNEVDILISDLIVRLKQLMFNSLLCAYYVGFIPMLFAESYIYYDRWWSIELSFFIWANSFVIISSYLLPPSYCHLLHQCALHLGCWARCSTVNSAPQWSSDIKWPFDAVVEWNTEYFKGEGPQNVAVPCDSSQECFYLLFSSQLHIHSWLLAMQCIIVTFEIVVLMRVTY